MGKNYTVYHLHTEDSLLDSCTNYKSYVDKAKELGQTAIAFTEHGNIYNWIEKKMYCDENNIKYIHGMECYLTIGLDEKIRDNYHTILLAKNYKGVQEINRLIELSTKADHFYYKPRITFDEFLALSDNVIKISACLASPLNCLRNNNEVANVYDRLCKHYNYFEIQPHINSDEQKEYNKYLYELSLKYNKPLIMGTDTHSIDSYKAECRTIRQWAKKITFTNEDEFDLTYKSYNELVNMCKQQNALPMDVYLQAIQNTNVMADSVNFWELDKKVKYPKSYDDEEAVFKRTIVNKYKDKLENDIIKNDPRYLENVKEEMRVFKKTNMVGFMLFMSELMTWCRDNGIPTSPCRGSVGGSTIAYLTDIIDVNPIIWNTVFSRFANEDRVEVGDIDVDIAPDQRNLVYQHIIDKFGTDKTAYILAIGTTSDKGTIDDIGRALSYQWITKTYGELSDKTIKQYSNSMDNPYSLDVVDRIKSEYAVNAEKAKKDYSDLFYYFDGILGTAVSQSMHPAGIVVSPITLSDNYGMFWGKNTDGDDILILPINMDEVHECGLVKYDILGLKNIQILRECCKLANIKYPLSHEIDWEDKNVWEHITDSSVGIFQFEGDYAFSLLKQYQPKRINDLSLVNASLRPSGASYRDRLIARETNKNPSQQIDDLLKENNGFLVFQEDVIKFLKDICGLSGGEADNVRRAIGRKQMDRLQKALPQILEGYCSKSDKPREIAEQEAKTFLQIIEDSSNYMFGYNHSTGYSMVGYLCAYMRYYYPLEFITSYLNCSNSQEDIISGTELAKTLNIKIKNIKFGKSIDKYACDKATNAIYKGISSIKYLNSQVAKELFELAHNNQYDSFIELLKDINDKTSCDDRQLKILITLGFFSDFGENGKLLKIVELYNNLMSRKQIKISDIEKLDIDERLLQKYSQTRTPKIYKDLDMEGYITEIVSTIPNKPLNIKKQIESECEYLGTPNSIWKQASDDYYIVIEFEKYKNPNKPYCTLYQVNSGNTIKTKVKDEQFFILAPFTKYSIIKVVRWKEQQKSKLINGKWQKTDELENIISEWETIA